MAHLIALLFAMTARKNITTIVNENILYILAICHEFPDNFTNGPKVHGNSNSTNHISLSEHLTRRSLFLHLDTRCNTYTTTLLK